MFFFLQNTNLSLPLETANMRCALSSFKHFLSVFLMLSNNFHFFSSGHLHKIFHLGHTEKSEAGPSHYEPFSWEKIGNTEQ